MTTRLLDLSPPGSVPIVLCSLLDRDLIVGFDQAEMAKTLVVDQFTLGSLAAEILKHMANALHTDLEKSRTEIHALLLRELLLCTDQAVRDAAKIQIVLKPHAAEN